MKAYHIDKSGYLAGKSNIAFQEIPISWKNNTILKERYPEGLSQWGKTVLGLENVGSIDLTYTENKEPFFNSYMTDLLFEYERLTSFKEKHSRFQSIFATKTIEEAKIWSKIISGKSCAIYEIEFDVSQVLELDPSYLKTQLKRFELSSVQQNSHKYWSGQKNPKTNSTNELLVKLPVKINRLVSSPMLHIHKG